MRGIHEPMHFSVQAEKVPTPYEQMLELASRVTHPEVTRDAEPVMCLTIDFATNPPERPEHLLCCQTWLCVFFRFVPHVLKYSIQDRLQFRVDYQCSAESDQTHGQRITTYVGDVLLSQRSSPLPNSSIGLSDATDNTTFGGMLSSILQGHRIKAAGSVWG